MLASAGLTDRLVTIGEKRNLISVKVFQELLLNCTRRDPTLIFSVTPMTPIVPDPHAQREAEELAALLYQCDSGRRIRDWGSDTSSTCPPCSPPGKAKDATAGNRAGQRGSRARKRKDAVRHPVGARLIKEQYYKPIRYHFKVDDGRPTTADGALESSNSKEGPQSPAAR